LRLLVEAPPLFDHRRDIDGELQRRTAEEYGGDALHWERERTERTRRSTGSPGV
jgi:hypothetical protein